VKIQIAITVLVLNIACSPPGPRVDPPHSLFEEGSRMGKPDPELAEVSGLVASRVNKGLLWAHNDSRNDPELFLIDSLAQIIMTCRLPVPNRDWEDIAIGKGPDPGKWYIYLGDIGDNQFVYATKFIYRFPEPIVSGSAMSIKKVDTISVMLEDGARDAETLLIDPVNNDLIILSKWETPARMYRVPYPFSKEVITAKRTLEINLTEVTAGDISPDGKEILLKSYNDVYYWRRSEDISLEALLANPPMLLSYQSEFQGEAIAWALDGKGYYTLSESRVRHRADLIYYRRVQ
jgi:hypothetical protein